MEKSVEVQEEPMVLDESDGSRRRRRRTTNPSAKAAIRLSDQGDARLLPSKLTQSQDVRATKEVWTQPQESAAHAADAASNTVASSTSGAMFIAGFASPGR